MNAHRIKLDIPANTPESSPVSGTIKLEYGVLSLVEIAFPDGCADLVHVRVLDGLRQISPMNEGEFWAWNDYTLKYDPHYELTSQPFSLTVEGWNEDIYYDKYVIFRLYVDPKGLEPGGGLLSSLWNLMPKGR